jgi:hypothetical protein
MNVPFAKCKEKSFTWVVNGLFVLRRLRRFLLLLDFPHLESVFVGLVLDPELPGKVLLLFPYHLLNVRDVLEVDAFLLLELAEFPFLELL